MDDGVVTFEEIERAIQNVSKDERVREALRKLLSEERVENYVSWFSVGTAEKLMEKFGVQAFKLTFIWDLKGVLYYNGKYYDIDGYFEAWNEAMKPVREWKKRNDHKSLKEWRKKLAKEHGRFIDAVNDKFDRMLYEDLLAGKVPVWEDAELFIKAGLFGGSYIR